MSSLQRLLYGIQRFCTGTGPEPYECSEANSKIELGCGPNKVRADAVGIDQLDLPGVDIVGQLPGALESVPDGSVDVVFTRHFLEHVTDLHAILDGVARVLRPGGRLIVVVPHFSNPYFYSDPTHQRPFGLYSMSYFSLDAIHRRQVPKYMTSTDDIAYRLLGAELRFPMSWKRPVTRVVAHLTYLLLRRSLRARELYEQRYAWWFPCHEIRFELERRG